MVCVSCSTFLCCMDQHWLKSHPAIFCFKSMLTPRWLFLLLLTLFWVGCYGCYDLQQWMIYCGILQVLPKLSVYFVYINMLAAYDWLSSINTFFVERWRECLLTFVQRSFLLWAYDPFCFCLLAHYI